MIAIDLTGKVALVTGAGQGLGRVTAARLHAAGATVVLNDLPPRVPQEAAPAEAAAAELGERACACLADIRDTAQLDALFATIRERYGRLDIVVNNAAVLRDRTLRKMSDEEWQTVIDTNLTGVFRVCREAAKLLAEGGRIISLASISGVVGFYGQVNYSAAKAGVIAITKVLSKELAARNITVNAVAPGVVLTEMGKSIPEEVREQMLAQIPLHRFGDPEEIANAILFLSSDLAAYVTGQTLHVNGGWWG